MESKGKVNHSERGVALLIAIFTLLLLTAIGAGMIMLTNTDTTVSANFRDEQTAFFGAKAGMEEVRDRFRQSATNSLYASLPVNLPGQSGGVVYVTNPKGGETDTPWLSAGSAYPDDEICTEIGTVNLASCSGTPASMSGTTWYTTASASSTYAASPVLPWKWARITVKTNNTSSGTTAVSAVDGVTTHNNYRVCWTGTGEISIPYATACTANVPPYQPVFAVTALAVTPSGSRRMIQSDVVTNTFPTIPGALVLDGSNPTFKDPNSNKFSVIGTDAAQGSTGGVGCPAATNEPAIGAFNAASVTSLTSGLARPASYTEGALPTPAISNVSALMPSLDTVGGLEALVSEITSVGNVSSGAPANPGTVANPQINVVTGNLSVGPGFSGAGILLVEGNLEMKGNFSFNGLILVIGTGSITKDGGGNGSFDGAILAANLYNSATPPALLPSTSAPGIPTMDWSGGGNSTITYDSCWSSSLSKSLPYKIVAVREMMF